MTHRDRQQVAIDYLIRFIKKIWSQCKSILASLLVLHPAFIHFSSLASPVIALLTHSYFSVSLLLLRQRLTNFILLKNLPKPPMLRMHSQKKIRLSVSRGIGHETGQGHVRDSGPSFKAVRSLLHARTQVPCSVFGYWIKLCLYLFYTSADNSKQQYRNI